MPPIYDKKRAYGTIKRLGYGDFKLFGTVDEPGRHDEICVEKSLEAITDFSKSEEPWCLYTGFIGPHDPYCVPEKYVNMYDIIGIQNRLKDQNQKLEKLEKALDHENAPKPISDKIEMLKQKLIEIIGTLDGNFYQKDQAKRYEVWKYIKFNVMESEIKPLYEELRKKLRLRH